MYTKMDGEDRADGGNEGQKLVWEMQDMQKGMDENEIEAPELLAGMKLADEE